MGDHLDRGETGFTVPDEELDLAAGCRILDLLEVLLKTHRHVLPIRGHTARKWGKETNLNRPFYCRPRR
jgi:hypothetical protein